MAITLRRATEADADALADMVNRAYRPSGDAKGWTHEAMLIGGPRLTAAACKTLLREGATVLVLCDEAVVVACVQVDLKAGVEPATAYIGLLAAEPSRQGTGLGKRMLAEAEGFAQREWGARAFCMTVLTARPELIAFYERRGYCRSGMFEAFPLDKLGGELKTADLRLEVLRKSVA